MTNAQADPLVPPVRRRLLPRGGPVRALFGYTGVVVMLVGVSSLTQDSVGPALYLVAAALTLPVGFVIYPALWLNVLVASAAHDILGFSRDAVPAVQLVGVFVVFAVAALLNDLLAQYTWRTIHQAMNARAIRRDTRSK